MTNNIVQTINDIIPSPESLYGDLGNHWDLSWEGRGYAVHPVCAFAEVGSYQPTSKAEEWALDYARRAAEWAQELVSLLQSLVEGGELAEEAAKILREASEFEREFGDDPLVRGIRYELDLHFREEVERAEGLAALREVLIAAEKAGVDTDGIDLPTFGGSEPSDTAEVWSWDATHLLVGDGPVSEWEIVPRADWAD